NAAINVVFTANAMLAAALGGILTAAFGAQATLAFDAATFVAVAALLRRAPLAHTEHQQARIGARQRVTEAIRYVRATRPLGTLLAADCAFTAFALLITPLEVVLVQGPLHAGGAALGFVLGGWGIGMIAGGAASTRATRHLGQHGVLAAGAAAQ